MQYRQTKQRQAILKIIESQGGHLTADQIYAQVRTSFPRLSLGTVYRNLRVLIAQSSVRELDFGESFKYFEAAKDLHYHLICRVCGQIADAAIPVDEQLTRLVRRARKTGGFRIEDHRLDFIGVCPLCLPTSVRQRTRPDKNSKAAKSR